MWDIFSRCMDIYEGFLLALLGTLTGLLVKEGFCWGR